MITSKNIIYHELVGLNVRVEKSSNPSLQGLEGEVIGETRNMLKIRTKKGNKMVPKAGCVFVFEVEGKLIKVLGDVLIGRPEDRLKKRVKRWRVLEKELEGEM